MIELTDRFSKQRIAFAAILVVREVEEGCYVYPEAGEVFHVEESYDEVMARLSQETPNALPPR